MRPGRSRSACVPPAPLGRSGGARPSSPHGRRLSAPWRPRSAGSGLGCPGTGSRPTGSGSTSGYTALSDLREPVPRFVFLGLSARALASWGVATDGSGSHSLRRGRAMEIAPRQLPPGSRLGGAAPRERGGYPAVRRRLGTLGVPRLGHDRGHGRQAARSCCGRPPLSGWPDRSLRDRLVEGQRSEAGRRAKRRGLARRSSAPRPPSARPRRGAPASGRSRGAGSSAACRPGASCRPGAPRVSGPGRTRERASGPWPGSLRGVPGGLLQDGEILVRVLLGYRDGRPVEEETAAGSSTSTSGSMSATRASGCGPSAAPSSSTSGAA